MPRMSYHTQTSLVDNSFDRYSMCGPRRPAGRPRSLTVELARFGWKRKGKKNDAG
jgi:hypothetical protein